MKSLLLSILLIISTQQANANIHNKHIILPNEVASWDVSLAPLEEGFESYKSNPNSNWWTYQIIMRKISITLVLRNGKSESYTDFCAVRRTEEDPNPINYLNATCTDFVNVLKKNITTIMNSSNCHPKYFIIDETTYTNREYQMCSGEIIKGYSDIEIGQDVNYIPENLLKE